MALQTQFNETLTANTMADLYTSTNGNSIMIYMSITNNSASVNATVEVVITDGSNNIKHYIIPTGTLVSVRNAIDWEGKQGIPNGYKIRIKSSVTTDITFTATIYDNIV